MVSFCFSISFFFLLNPSAGFSSRPVSFRKELIIHVKVNPITENIQNASTIWKDAFGWLTYVLVAELCYGAYPKK